MFNFGLRKRVAERPSQVFLTNTLSGKKERFVSLTPHVATLYSCGPTVYSRAHVGNLIAYIFSDTLARTLENAGYRVKKVINITDVGHLVSDGDTGEDKMSLGATREHTTPEAIATQYTKLFLDDISDLNINIKNIFFPRATEYIKEQIAMAKKLEEKGYAYRLPDGLYFDTQKFHGYGKLGGFSEADLKAGARVETIIGKHHPTDFVLWRAAKPNDLQKWDSPWGIGNPGWHIECSAMSRALLGEEIDIHTGGEDHVSVHHNNEIAQSEAANDKPFVHYWMHCAFMTINQEKISKSIGNVIYLSDLKDRGFSPLVLRYFMLQAHYRSQISFTWEAITAAAQALERMWRLVNIIKKESKQTGAPSEIHDMFLSAVRDDLSTPQAMSVLWNTLKSDEYTHQEKWRLVEMADAHFGLSLTNPPVNDLTLEKIPTELETLLTQREAARTAKDFSTADKIRSEIETLGYQIVDTQNGVKLVHKKV